METTLSQLHLMFNGQSHDIDMSDLDIGPMSSDQEVKEAVAEHMSVPVSKLSNFSVDKNTETGDITLRPGAIFGQ